MCSRRCARCGVLVWTRGGQSLHHACTPPVRHHRIADGERSGGHDAEAVPCGTRRRWHDDQRRHGVHPHGDQDVQGEAAGRCAVRRALHRGTHAQDVGRARGIREPELVVPTSAHAAFDKGACSRAALARSLGSPCSQRQTLHASLSWTRLLRSLQLLWRQAGARARQPHHVQGGRSGHGSRGQQQHHRPGRLRGLLRPGRHRPHPGPRRRGAQAPHSPGEAARSRLYLAGSASALPSPLPSPPHPPCCSTWTAAWAPS